MSITENPSQTPTLTVAGDLPTAGHSLGRLDDHGRSLLFTHARTANTFSSQPVTDGELDAIWELTKWAPTSANMQPLRVAFVRTEAGKQRLLPHVFEGNLAKTTAAPVSAVLALDSRFHEHIPTVFPLKPELKDVLEANDEMRVGSGDFNTALQAGYFILGVRALGLAAGPLAGFDKAGVDAEFFPDGRWRSVLVVNIGHPGADPWYDRLPRLDHAEALQWF
jgi:3-hydroxypropanoate dehydrogenase